MWRLAGAMELTWIQQLYLKAVEIVVVDQMVEGFSLRYQQFPFITVPSVGTVSISFYLF